MYTKIQLSFSSGSALKDLCPSPSPSPFPSPSPSPIPRPNPSPSPSPVSPVLYLGPYNVAYKKTVSL